MSSKESKVFPKFGLSRNEIDSMKNKKGIYCIENLVNGKKYIGQSDDLRRRINRHVLSLRKNKSSNIYLQRAYNKYGEKNFRIFIIEECLLELLNEKEIYYIDKLNSHKTKNGYNLSWGGEAFMRGVEITEEHRRKLSLASSGKNNAMWGKPASKASKDATSKYNKTKVFTQETKDKISYSNMGRKSKNVSSIYRGVTKDKCNCFIVRIANLKNKTREYIGYYRNEIDAAMAFDKKCWDYYHDLDKLNFPENYKNKDINLK